MFPRSTSIETDANLLLLFQLRKKRHGDSHEIPIMLRRHEMDEISDLVVGALLCSNPLDHRSHKLAVPAPAHLGA